MRFDLRPTSALALAGVLVLCASGCTKGALVKNADGAWTTDGGASWDVAAFIGPAGTQEFEIPGSDRMPEIHSVTVFDYSGPDYLHFGSAPLG